MHPAQSRLHRPVYSGGDLDRNVLDRH
jgi:hypothetical protein